MPELFLVVGGRRYSGWKSLRVTRSIESIAGSFALDVSDRWGALEETWPIAEWDPCRIEIDRTVVIDGYIGKRRQGGDANSRRLGYTGRDRAGQLVDCSALLSQWTFRNVSVADFAAAVAKPFGIRVTVQPGLTLARIPKVVINPGDTAYEAIKRVAADAAVLMVSDGAGGVVITRSGTTRAAPLVEGQNILSGDLEYDGEDRFHRYRIATQNAGTDGASGNATRVQAEATDEDVRLTERVILIRPDKGYSVADARRRVDWEARIRAARAETATVSVLGWQQPSGELWPVNAIAPVKAPRMLGVDGDMLISQVEYSIGDSGQVTQLRLVRPDAFTPEPKATVKPAGGVGGWKELAGGAF